MSFVPSLSGDTNLMQILMLAPERGKVLFEYTRAVQSDVDKILAAGWDERAYFDVVSVCALANFMNRLVDGTGTAMDGEALREMGGRIAEGG